MGLEAQGIRTLFAQLSAGSADAARIADIAYSIWRDVGSALSPIIGELGVAALFKRSVYLCRDAYPCLAAVFDDAPQHDQPAGLRAVLARQSPAAAVAANTALLQNFQDLLTTLIGAALGERLLRPVWENPSSHQAAQDTSS